MAAASIGRGADLSCQIRGAPPHTRGGCPCGGGGSGAAAPLAQVAWLAGELRAVRVRRGPGLREYLVTCARRCTRARARALTHTHRYACTRMRTHSKPAATEAAAAVRAPVAHPSQLPQPGTRAEPVSGPGPGDFAPLLRPCLTPRRRSTEPHAGACGACARA